jgi:hypothetical protein
LLDPSGSDLELSRGSHRSPRHGLCVVELASLLAGERFSDHPASVCPVIGSLIRSYNDAANDSRRQDLYPYAARILDTRSTFEVAEQRRARIVAWAREERPLRALPRWRGRSVPEPSRKTAGAIALGAIRRHTDRSHVRMLALLDELIEIGRPAEPRARPLAREREETDRTPVAV